MIGSLSMAHVELRTIIWIYNLPISVPMPASLAWIVRTCMIFQEESYGALCWHCQENYYKPCAEVVENSNTKRIPRIILD